MKTRFQKKIKGSAVISAVFVVTVLSMIIGSYLKVSVSEFRAAQRNLLYLSSLNLAEAGAEEAFRALNNGDFTDWEQHASAAGTRYLLKSDLGQVANGERHQIFVLTRPYHPSQPYIIAEGRISQGNMEVSQQVRIGLGRSSYFVNGLIARETLVLRGSNVKMDSFDSDEGPYEYSDRNDQVTVGSISFVDDDVDVGNNEIYGFVMTGGGDPRLGPNAKIHGKDTADGTSVDETRIIRDFMAQFDPVEHPTGDLNQGPVNNIGSIGTAGSETRMRIDSLRVQNTTTRIRGDVTLIVDGDFTVGGGHGNLIIEDGASLTLYIQGDVTLGGQGVANDNSEAKAANFQIYGTATPDDPPQKIDLGGQARMHAAVYAPEAEVHFGGGGNSTGAVFGAVIARTIQVNGNYSFHYDEALARMDNDVATRMTSWHMVHSITDRVDFDQFK